MDLDGISVYSCSGRPSGADRLLLKSDTEHGRSGGSQDIASWLSTGGAGGGSECALPPLDGRLCHAVDVVCSAPTLSTPSLSQLSRVSTRIDCWQPQTASAMFQLVCQRLRLTHCDIWDFLLTWVGYSTCYDQQTYQRDSSM